MTHARHDATAHLHLGDGPEFDTIRDFVARWGESSSGIGDDAAALNLPRGDRVVVSVDAFVEGRHFESGWITPREIGYRAAAAALSDLAAMAALPLGILFAVNVPAAWRDRLGAIADGVAEAARESGTTIVGGNIAAGQELSITTTVIGHAFDCLARGGAGIGDRLYVTGILGGPGASIASWRSGGKPTAIARNRFAHPVARIREARWLADRGATAGIDISDGLVADAGHLAAASGRRIEIHLDRLPCIDGVTFADAARSGEEYELLVAAPKLDAGAFRATFGLPLTEVGVVVEGAPGVVTLEHGARVAVATGHDHFSK